jgi:hypothetical protein
VVTMSLLFRGKLSRSPHRRARHTRGVYRASNASIREHTRKTSSRGRSTPAARINLLVTIISLPMALAVALGEAVVSASSSAEQSLSE